MTVAGHACIAVVITARSASAHWWPVDRTLSPASTVNSLAPKAASRLGLLTPMASAIRLTDAPS